MSAPFAVDRGPLILVNRDHPLTAEPAPDSLVPADSRCPDILLDRRAAGLLDRLLCSLGARSAIVPVSGYRPMAQQEAIWEDTLEQRGLEFTQTYVARPGCSEHQTGLAIDLGENKPPIDFICPAFPDEGVCRAFRLRCADFGFVLRYPAGREDVTGIGHEPWHFRYVGWPHARLMSERGLVLEEYIDLVRRHPEEGPRLTYRTAGRDFEIFHVAQDRLEGLADRLPGALPCQISGDNVDGVIVTLWRDV